MKSGNLKFLEPSGPLHARKGTAFTLGVLRNSYWNIGHAEHLCNSRWYCCAYTRGFPEGHYFI